MVRNYPHDRIISVLKATKLFNQFDDSQLIQLMAFATVEHFEKDAQIIQENKPNQNIYILLEGRVAIYVGDELILKLRRKGDIIGEMSVITKSLTTASVLAATPVVLFTIPSRKIYDSGQIELRSIWFKLFSDILAQKLSMTNKKVLGFQEATAELDQKKIELIKKTMILQSVLGSMDDGVVVTDGRGQVLHVNKAFARMTGKIKIPVEMEEWPETIGIFNADGQTVCRVRDLPMVKAENGILTESDELYIKNDCLEAGIWLQATSSLLKTDEGKLLDGSVVVFRDYTKKKLEEQALIRARDNAQAAAKAKSDFLSVMSHELRTPLNGIMGMSDLLKGTSLTREQREYLDIITRSGKGLLAKIKNILYYNNLGSSKVQIKKEELSLRDIIDNIIKFHEPGAQKKDMIIVAKICKTAETFFSGDREKIIKAVDNLVDNAVKYSSRGVITVSVAVVTQNLSWVKFHVKIRDEGIGLSREHIQSIFQPFFQADASLSRKFEGTGLGLAVTKRVVEMMGGILEVESHLGKGSCMGFTLVLSRLKTMVEQREESPAVNIKSLINKNYAGRRPFKILVAEDNKVNQLLIKKVLANLGYHAHIAENGIKALEACRNQSFDLRLLRMVHRSRLP